MKKFAMLLAMIVAFALSMPAMNAPNTERKDPPKKDFGKKVEKKDETAGTKGQKTDDKKEENKGQKKDDKPEPTTKK